MKKWDKSYTYAIVTVAVFAIAFAAIYFLQHRSFRFEGSGEIQARLEDWTPETAAAGVPHLTDGEILYYSVDCFRHFGLFDSYQGPGDTERRFLKSDVTSADDVAAIAVLYFRRTYVNSYQNGAGAYRIDCTVYILEPATLEILASGTVEGGAPPATTSGGDRWGSAPSQGDCRGLAEKLVAGMR